MKTQLLAASSELFLLLALVAMLLITDGVQPDTASVTQAPAARVDNTTPGQEREDGEAAVEDGLRRQVLQLRGDLWFLDGQPATLDELDRLLTAETNTVRIEGLLNDPSRSLMRRLSDRGFAIELN